MKLSSTPFYRKIAQAGALVGALSGAPAVTNADEANPLNRSTSYHNGGENRGENNYAARYVGFNYPPISSSVGLPPYKTKEVKEGPMQIDLWITPGATYSVSFNCVPKGEDPNADWEINKIPSPSSDRDTTSNTAQTKSNDAIIMSTEINENHLTGSLLMSAIAKTRVGIKSTTSVSCKFGNDGVREVIIVEHTVNPAEYQLRSRGGSGHGRHEYVESIPSSRLAPERSTPIAKSDEAKNQISLQGLITLPQDPDNGDLLLGGTLEYYRKVSRTLYLALIASVRETDLVVCVNDPTAEGGKRDYYDTGTTILAGVGVKLAVPIFDDSVRIAGEVDAVIGHTLDQTSRFGDDLNSQTGFGARLGLGVEVPFGESGVYGTAGIDGTAGNITGLGPNIGATAGLGYKF